MSNFSELIGKRRSIRKYTETKIEPEKVEQILKAALKSPTSKNARPWYFIAVEDKDTLKKLTGCKPNAASFIENCALAIVVCADPFQSSVWIEDTSIASIVMQLQAEDLGLGSCWIQIRDRVTENETSSEDFIKDLLDIPYQLEVLSIITFGYKEQEKPPVDESKLVWERVHINKFNSQK